MTELGLIRDAIAMQEESQIHDLETLRTMLRLKSAESVPELEDLISQMIEDRRKMSNRILKRLDKREDIE